MKLFPKFDKFHFSLVCNGTVTRSDLNNFSVKNCGSYRHVFNHMIPACKFPQNLGGFGEKDPDFFKFLQISLTGKSFPSDTKVVRRISNQKVGAGLPPKWSFRPHWSRRVESEPGNKVSKPLHLPN